MTQRHLTADERERFRVCGYLVVNDTIAAADARATRSIAAGLYRRRAGRAAGDFLDLAGDDENPSDARLPQILMPVKYASQLAASPMKAIAWSIARDLLGEDAAYQGEHLIIKPPRSGAETLPHQDQAFWSGALGYESVSVWVPLQDVRENDGCLYFAPGSHLGGVRDHRPAGGDPLCNSLELVDAHIDRRTEPMRVGALSVHHCRTIHGAGPNVGPRTRFAYIYGFGLPTTPAAEPRDFSWLQAQRTARQTRAEAGGYALTKMRPER
jgi:phytanoyl-CoA hydroxylase